MEKAFEYRLYPNQGQIKLMTRFFGCVRWMYNFFLRMCMDTYEKTGKSPSIYECMRVVTQLKKQENTAWLAEVDSTALQQSLRDLDRAYQNFFREKVSVFRILRKRSLVKPTAQLPPKL